MGRRGGNGFAYRRLRDSVIDNSRRKRETGLFSIDPLRFDGAPIRQISSARPAKAIRRHPGRRKTPCDYPLEKGECAEQHLRYFYDKSSDSCRLFHYSGCNGNTNNFGSIRDCQEMCVKAVKGKHLHVCDNLLPFTEHNTHLIWDHKNYVTGSY